MLQAVKKASNFLLHLIQLIILFVYQTKLRYESHPFNNTLFGSINFSNIDYYWQFERVGDAFKRNSSILDHYIKELLQN